jgi:V8-like Glu-specific endopeptidase
MAMAEISRPLTSEQVSHLQSALGEKQHAKQAVPPKPLFPNIPTKHLTHSDLVGREAGRSTEAFRPRDVEHSFAPAGLAPSPRRTIKAKDKQLVPTNIFPPDRRYLFYDTSYPWRTLGRVTSPRGSGTGVLIGPQHLLTVSHIVQWNNDGTAGWLQFAPMYYGGTTPFGTANATLTYFYRKVGGSPSDADVAEDYVVCILDQRLGDRLGWMGSRVYTEDWDDGAYWDQVSFEDADAPGPFGFIIDIDSGDGLDIETETASITFGDSGGPYFGWWDGEVGPRVVAVQSAQGYLEGDNDNWAGGGDPMVHMIVQALSDHP